MCGRDLKMCRIFSIFCLLVFHEINNGLAQQTKTSFSCDGRISGYYADISTGCQVYHMCDGLGRQFSYTCPNATLFQQRMLICDHWYMVNCSRAEKDYSANKLIGQHKPFVEDKDYYRTPRPDLLSAPNESELNIIYRTGRNQDFTTKNIVGLATEEGGPTDRPTYFPPSHWSTSFSPPSNSESSRNTNREPQNQIADFQGNSFQRRKHAGDNIITRTRSKAINLNSSNKNGNNFSTKDKNYNEALPQKPVINFPSNFKATTPVYPPNVEDTTSSVNDIGLIPPIPNGNNPGKDIPPANDLHIPNNTPLPKSQEQQNLETQSTDLLNEKPFVVFESQFKATTPVYPISVEPTSPDPNEVGLQVPQRNNENGGFSINFKSNFRATTPVYPVSVEPTSPDPDDAGLLAPQEHTENFINFKSNYEATTPVYPTAVDPTSPDPFEAGLLAPQGNIQVNFESKYKATTPVYPASVEPTSPDPQEVGILGPKDEVPFNGENQNIPVNFESRFKATTPVYPTSVEPTSPDPGEAGLLPPQDTIYVVFASNFTATTPVYPTSVESTSPDPNDAGLLAPNIPGIKEQNVKETSVNFESNFKATTPVYPTHVDQKYTEPEDFVQGPDQDILDLNLGFLPPDFDENYKSDQEHNLEGKIGPPSKFYQPPKFIPDYTLEEIEGNEAPGIKILNFMKSFNTSQWQNLRRAFSIPEYDFPLDDATRPSYDSVLDSFDAKVEKKR